MKLIKFGLAVFLIDIAIRHEIVFGGGATVFAWCLLGGILIEHEKRAD